MQYDIDQLKQVLRHKGLTYKDLATAIGWSESKVKRCFTGRVRLKIDEYNRLVSVLLGEQHEEKASYYTLFTALPERDKKVIISLMQYMRDTG